jgi:hypothetical protein
MNDFNHLQGQKGGVSAMRETVASDTNLFLPVACIKVIISKRYNSLHHLTALYSIETFPPNTEKP